MKRRVIDQRNKEKFQIDDAYLNGMARLCGINATGVYAVLCRHANTEQEAFPSKKLIAEKLGISERSVYGALRNLEKHQVIFTEDQGRKSDGSFRVKNYILRDKSEWMYPQANGAVGKIRHSPQANNDTHRRHVVPNKETHIKETHKKDTKDDVLFEYFWKEYPKKVGKVVAQRSFKGLKVKEDLLKEILRGLNNYKETEQWQKDNGKYIPNPATFLNQRRWEDSLETDQGDIIVPEYAKNYNK